MTENAPTCPVCDRRTETLDATYRHLLVGHHKSSIAQALLTSNPNDDLGSDQERGFGPALGDLLAIDD